MDQSITEPIEIGKFLAAAMKETDLPWSRGGDNSLANLTVACASCNRSKSDRTPEEWLQ